MTETEIMDRKHQEDLQRIRSFRLLDDDFLTKCFDRKTDCMELVLQIVLENPDLQVMDVRTQVFVENLLNRSVRLDVLATDSTGRKFNVEIQRADKGAGRKRARYNSSMMDSHLLDKGKDVEMLPETYVIFITEHDVIGEGNALYPVNNGKKFGDGSHILYVNGAYQNETPIGKLMHDFSCTDASEMYYDVLAERVKFFKESKEGVAIMCRAMEEMRIESWQEGVEEGRKEGRKDTALRMLKAGKYALDEIAEMSGLSLEDVKALDVNKMA